MFLRNFRALRMVRAIRVLAIGKYMVPLKLLLTSIISSTGNVLTAFVFLALTLFCFAIVFVQACANHVLEFVAVHGGDASDGPGSGTAAGLLEHFGSVPVAMLSLFMALSGGNDWCTYTELLFAAHWSYGALFVFFIAFMSLCVMNIITGIFVGSTYDIAQIDRALAVQKEIEAQESYERNLRDLFQEFDDDHSGIVMHGEFNARVNTREVKAYLLTLGIEAQQAEEFFHVLQSGNAHIDGITMNEFVQGCLRLRGAAKNADVGFLKVQSKELSSEMRLCRQDFVQSALSMKAMEQRLSQLQRDLLDMRAPLPLLE